MTLKGILTTTKGRVMAAVPVATATSLALAPCAFAAEDSASSAVTESVSLITSVASLFSIYPINIFLGLGLASGAIATLVLVLKKVKH